MKPLVWLVFLVTSMAPKHHPLLGAPSLFHTAFSLPTTTHSSRPNLPMLCQPCCPLLFAQCPEVTVTKTTPVCTSGVGNVDFTFTASSSDPSAGDLVPEVTPTSCTITGRCCEGLLLWRWLPLSCLAARCAQCASKLCMALSHESCLCLSLGEDAL